MSKGKVKMPRYYGVDRVDNQVIDGKEDTDLILDQVAVNLVLTNQLGQKVSLNK